ncbi:type III secretion system export apparatus subunit SctU [Dokdonella sp.]|uniref:type III secretion system export apparatus subunit SctU n=1 Tax=Dokdonella sp. TaxID=2291710 RepID=UPI001B139240|nr:type III secretion system export apparatus subunit SctU [Dokdonella sp.]MBO9664253.1 type III secretion system export apparatus subunit SctU [Dokdonella sp.]
MAEENDTGNRTEKPTPQRLKKARKDGDVSKSKELTSTVLVMIWLVLIWLMLPSINQRVGALIDHSMSAMGQPFAIVAPALGWEALSTGLWICLPLLFGAVFIATLTDFLQGGPVLAPKKVKPDIKHVNPMSGIKKIFSKDNLVEVAKAIIKSSALIGIFIAVLFTFLPQIAALPFGQPTAVGELLWSSVTRIGIWVIFVFFFLSALDAFYQRFSFMKKMRMSIRDIRQETKENEGDPYIKGRRRQLHQEWAQQNMLSSVRRSSVVVTNPTHLAIAILYEPGETELPMIVAKGEDYEAKLIREAAEEAGVPVMQNVDLARGLYERAELDDYLPSEFFEAVAELLRWAESVREQRDGK